MLEFDAFERIVRKASAYAGSSDDRSENSHVFDIRNIHPKFPPKVRHLFDDGHYSEAAFEALKYLDKQVQRLAGENCISGQKLMMSVFGGQTPKIKLNSGATQSEKDEQDGYKFIFAGIMAAIRNPKGHEYNLNDNLDTCLDYLSFISFLIRRLEYVGYDFK
ncbi:MAG: TIGR02391 family protein [Rhodomicrobiaceae bacterium]